MLPRVDEEQRETLRREHGTSAAAVVAVEAHFESAAR